MPERHPLAFLANRKLHVCRNGSTEIIESEYERSVRERAASIERRHAWKTQGRGAMFLGAWAIPVARADQVPVSLTGLTAGHSGDLVYSMETDAVSGIFLLDASGLETRMFHTADFRLRHATLHSDGETLAATAFHNDSMRSNIAVLPLHGTDFTEVTEGDSLDQMPRWSPGPHRRIVFQSAGIGRDAAGHFSALGPYAIQRLDLESRDLEELVSDDNHDFLQPREAEDGTLYFIRKPYESGLAQPSLLGSIKDAALFPFRLGRALFQFFNFFSMKYSGRPLVTAKGAVQRQLDPRQLFIYGNLARAQMTAQSDEAQNRVPSSWELIRATPGGRKEVLASHVLAFDLAADGSALYSNGASITRLAPDGHSERLLEAEQIEQVLAL
jgi:hypothetical protein